MRKKRVALEKMNRALMYFSKNYFSVTPPSPPSYHTSICQEFMLKILHSGFILCSYRDLGHGWDTNKLY